MPELAAAGVRGIAVSSAVCSAADPAAVVTQLLAQLPA
jgi:thiamine monophosphate synthase